MFNHLLAMTSFLVQSGRGFLHVVTWNKPRLAHCGCYIVPVPGNGHDDKDDDLSNTNVTFIEPVPHMTILFFLFRPQCSPPESAFIVLTASSFTIQQGQIDRDSQLKRDRLTASQLHFIQRNSQLESLK